MRFSEHVVIVTGAGSGIGKAIAIKFAQEGADIVIPDINIDDAITTAKEIEKLGRQSLAIPTDVSNSQDVQSAVDQAISKFNHIDVLVNNAGINLYKKPFDFTDEEWNNIIGVNLTGVWFFCRYVGPHMVSQGKGSIVNVASIGAVQASYYRAPYMASKGGVASLTRALALDLAEHNIRVNAVGPGMVETGMTRPMESRLGVISKEFGNWISPMNRWSTPMEVANAVTFLASDESSFTTGQMLSVDGGLSSGNPMGKEWPPVLDSD